MRKKRM